MKSLFSIFPVQIICFTLKIAIKSLGKNRGAQQQIERVTVLDSPEEIDWVVKDDALYVTTPSVAPNDIAICYKIELGKQ